MILRNIFFFVLVHQFDSHFVQNLFATKLYTCSLSPHKALTRSAIPTIKSVPPHLRVLPHTAVHSHCTVLDGLYPGSRALLQ